MQWKLTNPIHTKLLCLYKPHSFPLRNTPTWLDMGKTYYKRPSSLLVDDVEYANGCKKMNFTDIEVQQNINVLSCTFISGLSKKCHFQCHLANVTVLFCTLKESHIPPCHLVMRSKKLNSASQATCVVALYEFLKVGWLNWCNLLPLNFEKLLWCEHRSLLVSIIRFLLLYLVTWCISDP